KKFERTMFNGAPTATIGAPFREKRWDPAFTIAYDVTDAINIYARYAQAYRAGGVSVRSLPSSPLAPK
uniref:TonB-dependent receptor n=1 Tax=Sphingobium fuliginis (strain ATCC 27551) TaxID=336203 RepID=UPI000561B161